VLSSPIVIHLYRPYASEEEYIAHERFSIEAKSMLLIDQAPLPFDTAVVFDVTLENGHKPIRAEGRVVGHVEPEADRPGGLRVRFRRFGAATKAFIDRAVNGTPAVDSKPIASIAPALDSSPMASVSSTTPRGAPVLAAAPAFDAPVGPAPFPAAVHVSAPLKTNDSSEADETSGIHTKTSVSPVAAPANREALLARLRGRRVS